MVKGRVYTMDQRAKALADVAELGLAEAAKKTGIPKSTLSHWAGQEGVATVIDEDARKRTEAATAVSQMSRKQRLIESENRLTVQLSVIAELAARAEIDILRKGKPTLNEVVGARTRAIHDLQLLGGKATERTEVVETAEDVASLRDQLRLRIVGP